MTYEKPVISDHGDIVALTLACQGSGMEDGNAKSEFPFLFSQPDEGDPGFCEP